MKLKYLYDIFYKHNYYEYHNQFLLYTLNELLHLHAKVGGSVTLFDIPLILLHLSKETMEKDSQSLLFLWKKYDFISSCILTFLEMCVCTILKLCTRMIN